RAAHPQLLEGSAHRARAASADALVLYPDIGAASRRPWGRVPRPDTPVSSYAGASNRRVCSQKRNVNVGQIEALRPLASRYQLEHPPVFQTVPARRDWRWTL